MGLACPDPSAESSHTPGYQYSHATWWIHEFAEGRLDPLIQIFNNDIKVSFTLEN